MSRKRSNGEGSIYRRKDGRYEGSAYVPVSNGSRRRLRVYGTTRAEASTKLIAALSQADKGIPAPTKTWKVGDYLDYWMREVVPANRRPKTIELYESTVRIHLKPVIGHVPLAKLSVATLQKAFNDKLATGTSPRMAQLTRNVLSAALHRAQRDELIFRNVARLVELPTAHRKEVYPWNVDEARQFLASARSTRHYPALLMLSVYGMRRGEVLGLRRSDIDLDQGVIHVRQQLQHVKDGLIIGPVKTNASQRDLPLINAVREALVDQIGVADEHSAQELLFRGKSGKPIHPKLFGRIFQQVRQDAGVRPITMHQLRHTAATLLKNLGVPARDTQLILGHSNIVTTQQIYQHADTTGQQTALNEIGRVLLEARDGTRCRQDQPSKPSISLENRSPTPVLQGERTPKVPYQCNFLGTTKERTLTSVIERLRARTNAHLLGYVAVKLSRQTHDAADPDLCTSFAMDALRKTIQPKRRPRPWNTAKPSWSNPSSS